MTTPAPIPAHTTTAWDKAAVVTLGAAACALSYDALQQMAASIHIRGALTYLFPLIIDGFIAYGVRGLLVLRAAPFTARLYAWTLFGTASAVSIWANALHAVRLNQQGPPGAGLRLEDVTVGVLSTVA
ncbi:DUF2637 domain-containing protein, partial [Streptomyces jumonjinensis]